MNLIMSLTLKGNIFVQSIKVQAQKYGILNPLKDSINQQLMHLAQAHISPSTMSCLMRVNTYCLKIEEMENVDLLMDIGTHSSNNQVNKQKVKKYLI